MATIAMPLRRVDIARTGTVVPLIVGLVGTLLSWFGSGWDVSWHRIFGRDTFWSTPHLFIYTGVALWGVAAMIATATAMAGRPIRGRALVLGPFRAELGLALIGVGALVGVGGFAANLDRGRRHRPPWLACGNRSRRVPDRRPGPASLAPLHAR